MDSFAYVVDFHRTSDLKRTASGSDELGDDLVGKIRSRTESTIETVLANAEYYLDSGVSSLWGGMTTEGIDCSGFV